MSNKFEAVISGSIEKINGLKDVSIDLIQDNDYGHSEIFDDIHHFLEDNIEVEEGQCFFFIATVTGEFETYNTWEGTECDINYELIDIIKKDVSYLMNTKTVMINLDDTLIQTQKLYDKVKSDTIDLIIAETGTDKTKEELLEMFSVLHVENSKKQVEGFFGIFTKLTFKEKFRLSFEELYTELIGTENVSKEFIEKLNESAMNVFYYKSELYEGAEDFLKKLKEFGFYVCLITNGDYDVQERRIKTNNIKKYFDQVIISSEKKEHMEEFLNKVRLENIMMIGNSFKSDIEPALSLDINSIHINQGNWVFDNHEVDESLKEKDIYHQVNNYTEILEVFKKKGWITSY